MADELNDELAALRARAYGAHADIHRDPAALARLRELEHRVHAQIMVPRPPVPPLPPAPREPEAEAGAAAGAPQASLPRRFGLRAAAALVAATALIVAPVTLWIASLADRPYAVLQASDEAPINDYFGDGTPDQPAQRYDDFAGLAVTISNMAEWQGMCLSVTSGDADEPSFVAGNCAPYGLSVIADLVIGPDIPQVSRDALPGITGLRFVYEGDVVRVYAVSAASSAAASRSSLPDDPISNTSPSMTRIGTPLIT